VSIATAVLLVAVGVGVGYLAGLLGVGGGVLMVPFLVLVLDESQHVAEGTSLAVIVPTAIAGVIVHVRNRNVDLRVGGVMAIGGIAGAYLGASLALALDATALQRIFAVVIAAMGFRYIYKAWRES
jgi:uncharacterized membrane protein YfcA